MEDPFKKGATVRQVVPVVQGPVKDVKFDAETMSFSYLVEYTDSEGDTHERWFQHKELIDATPQTAEA